MKLTGFAIIVFAALYCQPLSATSLGDRLANIFNTENTAISDEILDPEDAFKVLIQANRDNSVTLDWNIEPGYYLYHDKFRVNVSGDDQRTGSFTIPAGKLKQDPVFGAVQVHYNSLSFDVPIINAAASGTVLEVDYQGCKENAVCYPPIHKTFNLALFSNAVAAPAINTEPLASTTKISEQDAITRRLLSGSFLINVLSFFGFGFLLSLTPCVFPMIPILSGLIVGQSGSLSTLRAFILSLAFVLAMALTYAILGVIAGSLNINLQAASQNVWAIALFSGVFVLLALSMFGFYQLQLPESWQNKLNAVSEGQSGSSVKGAAIMGAVSAIIVGPCVAPPLAGALLYISQTGDALLGGTALFLMGLGFGVPLLIIGASVGRLLPRAGAWMNAVKGVFGVLMLGVAIWLLERVLASSLTLLLWASLFIISAIYMGALDKVDPEWKWSRFKKGLGLVIMSYGVIMICGSATGGGTLLQPLKAFHGRYAGEPVEAFTYVEDTTALDQALAAANRAGKPVLVNFYADWCAICNDLEKYTFADSNVQQLLSRLVLLKVDVTQNNADDKSLLQRFNLFGPPALLFFDREIKELEPYRVVGFIDPASFSLHLQEVIAF